MYSSYFNSVRQLCIMENGNGPGVTRVVKAEEKHVQLLAEIGKRTFLESHGHSASRQDIDIYVANQYSEDSIRKKMADPKNLFSILFYNDEPVGFSNIIPDASLPAIEQKNITELDKLYLLQSFHGLQLGNAFIQYNIEISKTRHQSGMWLYVWKENAKAITFYKKHGFGITGSHDFKISETKSNPNHLMWLKY